MSIKSLGRAMAAPSLREPVSQQSNAELGKYKAKIKESAAQQAAPEQAVHRTNKAENVRVERKEETTTQSPSANVEQFQNLMLGNRGVELGADGPLSKTEVTIIDSVNNIDFEREFPPEALKQRIFQLREDFRESLKADNIKFDSDLPLDQMVLTIKQNINDAEFVQHLPRALNGERVQGLTSFGMEGGDYFTATA